MSIFERLREERIRLGLSQAQLGEIGGVQKQAQLKYEKGDRQPDARYLEAVAGAGVDVLYVLTGQRVAAPAPVVTSYGRANVVALPANEHVGLSWRQVLVVVIDELNKARKRMPGDKLVELVDLLMEWQREGVQMDAEKVSRQIKLIA